MSLLPEYWPYLMVVIGAVFIAFIVTYLTRVSRDTKPFSPKVEVKETWPSKSDRSVTPIQFQKSKNELRILELEREIISFAIRRLYEAQAEGKISENGLERLITGYRRKMEEINDTISRSGAIVALHELEEMQDNLFNLFSDRFEDLNKKIQELRSRLNIDLQEIPTLPSIDSQKEEKKQEQPLDESSKVAEEVLPKSGAEERIKKIKEDIERVMGKLEKVETEE